MRFKDLEKKVTHEAGEEFEMTLKRANELVENIKKNHGIDIILTRLDVEEKEEKEKTNKSEVGEGK